MGSQCPFEEGNSQLTTKASSNIRHEEVAFGMLLAAKPSTAQGKQQFSNVSTSCYTL